MEITLCSRSPPLMNLISPPLPISSFCLAQRTSCPPSPRSREENKGALSPFSVSPFKRDGPVTLLSPSFPLRVIHIEAFTLLGCLESVPSLNNLSEPSNHGHILLIMLKIAFAALIQRRKKKKRPKNKIHRCKRGCTNACT